MRGKLAKKIFDIAEKKTVGKPKRETKRVARKMRKYYQFKKREKMIKPVRISRRQKRLQSTEDNSKIK